LLAGDHIQQEPISTAVARGQDKDDGGSNNSRRNQHPVLSLDSQNGELFSQKLHELHPLSCATYVLGEEKYIIFISRFGEAIAQQQSPPSERRAAAMSYVARDLRFRARAGPSYIA
jgi:hypothetical protein